MLLPSLLFSQLGTLLEVQSEIPSQAVSGPVIIPSPPFAWLISCLTHFPDLLPGKLEQHLPVSAHVNITDIKDSFITATLFAWGTPERDAINKAYDEVMRIMLIIALVLLFVPLGLIAICENIDLDVADAKNDYGGVVIGNSSSRPRQDGD